MAIWTNPDTGQRSSHQYYIVELDDDPYMCALLTESDVERGIKRWNKYHRPVYPLRLAYDDLRQAYDDLCDENLQVKRASEANNKMCNEHSRPLVRAAIWLSNKLHRSE